MERGITTAVERRVSNAVERRLSDLKAHLSQLGAQNLSRNEKVILDLNRKHEEVVDLLASSPERALVQQKAMLVLTIPQLDLSMKDITVILQWLSEEVEQVVKLLLASLILCFRNLLFAIPQMRLLYRIVRRLSQAILLVLHDSSTFEDALGRMQSLQFQWFRHWPVFEANLRYQYDQLPGMQPALAKRYFFNMPKVAMTVTSTSWETLVRPGSTISMSILLEHVRTVDATCSWGRLTIPTRFSMLEHSCSGCNLLFGLSSEGKHAHNDASDTKVAAAAVAANTTRIVTSRRTQNIKDRKA